MTRLLYDLCATGDQRFSPYCWRAKLALRHKGLDYETVPVRFSAKHKIAFSGQDKMPVLDDGGTVVFDSFAIAEYLEAAYPEAPSLFPGANGRQLARMTNDWADGIHRELLSFVVYDIYGRLDAEDQAYFRPTREARYGDTLENVQAGRDAGIQAFRDVTLASIRVHLSERPFISGARPAYSDHIVFGTFQWARLVSEFDLLAPGDPVHAWRERMSEWAGPSCPRGPAGPAT